MRGLRVVPPIDCLTFGGLAPGAGILLFGEVARKRSAAELFDVVENAGETGRVAKEGMGAVKFREAGREYVGGREGVNLPSCSLAPGVYERVGVSKAEGLRAPVPGNEDDRSSCIGFVLAFHLGRASVIGRLMPGRGDTARSLRAEDVYDV
jgi:hypothetical protein